MCLVHCARNLPASAHLTVVFWDTMDASPANGHQASLRPHSNTSSSFLLTCFHRNAEVRGKSYFPLCKVSCVAIICRACVRGSSIDFFIVTESPRTFLLHIYMRPALQQTRLYIYCVFEVCFSLRGPRPLIGRPLGSQALCHFDHHPPVVPTGPSPGFPRRHVP